MLLLSAATAAAAVGVAAHATFHRNSPVFGRVLARLPADDAVALTFDDGPNPEATPRVLDVLRQEQVPATFFLLGRHVDRWPAVAARVASEGHAIGNHGYHHRKLHRRGPGYVRLDIALGAESIVRATGVSPRWFRAPHGFRNPWVSAIAAEMGQRTVGWTLGVYDSDRPGADVIARRSVTGLRGGGILLLHDGDGYDPAGDRTQTAEALPGIIRGLRNAGLRFVSLGA